MKGQSHDLHFFVESPSIFFKNIVSSERMLRPEETMVEVNDMTHIPLFQEGADTFVTLGSDSSRGSFSI